MDPTTRGKQPHCKPWPFGNWDLGGGETVGGWCQPTKCGARGVSINRLDLFSVPVGHANLLWRGLRTREANRQHSGTSNIRIEVIVTGISRTGTDWTCGLEFDYANSEVILLSSIAVRVLPTALRPECRYPRRPSRNRSPFCLRCRACLRLKRCFNRGQSMCCWDKDAQQRSCGTFAFRYSSNIVARGKTYLYRKCFGYSGQLFWSRNTIRNAGKFLCVTKTREWQIWNWTYRLRAADSSKLCY